MIKDKLIEDEDKDTGTKQINFDFLVVGKKFNQSTLSNENNQRNGSNVF